MNYLINYVTAPACDHYSWTSGKGRPNIFPGVLSMVGSRGGNAARCAGQWINIIDETLAGLDYEMAIG